MKNPSKAVFWLVAAALGSLSVPSRAQDAGSELDARARDLQGYVQRAYDSLVKVRGACTPKDPASAVSCAGLFEVMREALSAEHGQKAMGEVSKSLERLVALKEAGDPEFSRIEPRAKEQFREILEKNLAVIGGISGAFFVMDYDLERKVGREGMERLFQGSVRPYTMLFAAMGTKARELWPELDPRGARPRGGAAP